jgi:hypothetical protein
MNKWIEKIIENPELEDPELDDCIFNTIKTKNGSPASICKYNRNEGSPCEYIECGCEFCKLESECTIERKEVTDMHEALKEIIALNRQTAFDKYGDAEKAES